jgi:predicted DNA-binding protein
MKKEKSHDRGESQTALTFSLPKELKKRIEAAAKRERRNKSNWITVKLEEILKEYEEDGGEKKMPQ